MLTITTVHHTAADVIHVAGELDASSASELGTAVHALLRDTRPARRVVVLDLDRVEFFAAAGLHVLELAHQRCGEKLELRLVTTNTAVLRVLGLFYLDQDPPVYSSLEMACAP